MCIFRVPLHIEPFDKMCQNVQIRILTINDQDGGIDKSCVTVGHFEIDYLTVKPSRAVNCGPKVIGQGFPYPLNQMNGNCDKHSYTIF